MFDIGLQHDGDEKEKTSTCGIPKIHIAKFETAGVPLYSDSFGY